MTQLAIKWPSSFPFHPTSASALPGEKKTSKILHFYSMQYHYLIKIMHIWHIFFEISSTLVESLLNCFPVQLLTVIFKISAICANTGKEMHSPFVDSSIDNVLLQTSTSRFLSSLIFLNSIP